MDFVSHFYYEIISRFAELIMTDVNFEWMYVILYEEYSIANTIVFDIETDRFGLREIF